MFLKKLRLVFILFIGLFTNSLIVNAQCDPNQKYDKIVSGYHQSVALKQNGIFSVWGQDLSSSGTGDVLSPIDLNSTNYPALAGTVLKVTIGGDGGSGREQAVALTTTGLFAWGTEGYVFNNTLTSSAAFQKIGTPNDGDATTKLPIGVNPSDVVMMQASNQTLAILTNSGNVWILTQASLALEGNGGSASTAGSSSWKKVKTSSTTDLNNVIAIRGQVSTTSLNAFAALTSSGEVYTWGSSVYLGNNTASTSASYATLMTLPAEFTSSNVPKMIGVTGGDKSIALKNTYYILSNNGSLYALGDNSKRQCGDFTTSERREWVKSKINSSTEFSNVNFISVQEHDASFPGVSVITLTGDLYTWGENGGLMLGRQTEGNAYDPGLPGGFTSGTDKAIFSELGGHTLVYIKEGSSQFCYVGHKVAGSMGDGTITDTNINTFDCSNTPNLEICGSVPVVASTANSTISANPTSITANGTSTSTITIQLKDASGNNLTTSGGVVVVTTSQGSLGQVVDNNNGTYTVFLTSSSNTGTGTINFKINGNNATNSTTVAFVAQAALSSLGCVTIVASGGDAENSTWTYSNNIIMPNSAAAVKVDASVVLAKMALGNLTVAGSCIYVNENVNYSLNSNGITFKASDFIIVAANKSVSIAAGDVIFWSDSDASGTATTSGGIIALLDASSITTSGGDIVLAGGADTNADGIPDGYSVGAYATSAHGATNSTAGLFLDNASLNAGAGNVILRGQGTGNLQNFQIGTRLYGGSILGSNITIDSKGSIQGPSSSNWGLSLEGFSIEGSGNIELTGIGGRAGSFNSDANQVGVEIRRALDNSSKNSQVKATGTGTITINGVGGSGTNADPAVTVPQATGIRIEASQTNPILSADGDIILEGTSGRSGRGLGLMLGSPISSTNGNITLIGNPSIEGTLNLNGNIEINGTITTGATVSIESPGAVSQTAAITADKLSLNGTGIFTLNNTSNNIATIAGGNATTKLGSISFTDASGGLTIGTVGSESGLTATGAISVETLAGDITLSEDVLTNNTTANAILINAGKSAAIGTATGGNIIVSGSPTVSTGTGGIIKLFSGSDAGSTGLTTFVGGTSNIRLSVDETSTTFTPALSTNNSYALYRLSAAPVNNAPTNLALSKTSITEKNTLAAVIGDLSSTDPDSGDTHTYTLVDGSGSADNTLFSIADNQLKVNAVFDYKTRNSYSIRIRTTDAGGLNFEKEITIMVLSDFDSDGIPDANDPDDDNDGILDYLELDCSANTAVSESLNPSPFYFVQWNSFSNGVLSGVINVPGDVINVTVTNSKNSILLQNDNPYGGTALWTPLPSGNASLSTFRSSTLGEHKFVFDKPVNNPRFFINSLNRTLDLSLPGKILKSNGKFTGTPYGTTTQVLVGNEGTGTISFSGNITEISFTGREYEFYCNFSLGISGLSDFSSCVDKDTDGDGTPDRLDLDSDGDGVSDAQELADGTSPTDLCSFKVTSQTLTPTATWKSTDCDGDGVDNETELADKTSPTDLCSFVSANQSLTPTATWNTTDCDGDGFDNKTELDRGSDPLVSNVAPTNISLNPNAINENAASGTTVGTLSSTDADAGDTHTYTLVSGTGSTDNALFTIDGTSLKTTIAFNFEVKNSYTIRIRTTDAGGLSYEKVITLTVSNVNEAPTDLELSKTSINENNATGAVLGTLSSTDPDTGDTHNYALVAGTGSTDNALFTLDGNNLKTTIAFDFETKSSYSVRIRTTDAGGLSYEKAITITVLDVNDAPTNLALSQTSTNENNAIGFVIGQLSSTDQDAGDTHTYTLVAGTGSTDNALFTIDGNNLKTTIAFDFETKSSYSVRLRTTDAGGLTYEKVITITVLDINDAPTKIASSQTSIYEKNAVGAVIGDLSTTDQDAGDKHTYTLFSGDVAAFKISGNQLLANVVFNFGNKNSYEIVVKSTDAGGLSVNKAIKITILQQPNLFATANLPRNTQSSAVQQTLTISKGYSANLNLTGSNLVKYEWSPSTGLSATNISNPIAKPSQTTTYKVKVTNAQGVSTEVYITIVVLEDYNITPNNVLSPDGDGVNDFWTIENLSTYPNNEVKIFDKAGRVIYNVRNYQNNWNGQLNGETLHEGAYYYVINLGPGTRPKIGYITLFSNK